jgi:hypothetical protein
MHLVLFTKPTQATLNLSNKRRTDMIMFLRFIAFFCLISAPIQFTP